MAMAFFWSKRAGFGFTSEISKARAISSMEKNVAVGGDRPAQEGQVVVQALGDHADKGRHSRFHSAFYREAHLVLGEKKADSHRHKKDADHADQAVQGTHHFRFGELYITFGLFRKPGCIGIGADMGETGGTMAAAYKAAGFQIIAGQLGNGIRFPCKQRLIYSNLPQKDNGIRTDLASVFEFHDIIPHKLGGRDFLPRAVPDTGNLLFRKKGEPVDCLLGTDFLKKCR